MAVDIQKLFNEELPAARPLRAVANEVPLFGVTREANGRVVLR